MTLSLHAKQPKRATICYDKGYIEIFEYPRADEAIIYYTDDNAIETIKAGKLEDALCYEIENMENLLSKIYGPVSLQRCRGRNGREHLIMFREDEV